MLAGSAHLHLDKPCAHAFLGKGTDDDKIKGWYLDTGATHHMTCRREFFSDLDSSVKGSVKFGDASAIEIKGVGLIIFKAKTGEHCLLTGVYYIPALRNSIISVGQLDENGSRVEVEDGVLRIWDRSRRLLAKVNRGSNRLTCFMCRLSTLFAFLRAGTMRCGTGMSASGIFTSRP
jgi:hypothetical protein